MDARLAASEVDFARARTARMRLLTTLPAVSSIRVAASRVYYRRAEQPSRERDHGCRMHRKGALMSLTVETFEPTVAGPAPVRTARKPLTPHWSRLTAAGVALALNALAIAGLAHLRAIDA